MSLLRLNRRPSPRQLLVFALAWLVVFGVLAAVQAKRGRVVIAEVLAVLAVLVPVVGGFWREGLRRVYVGLSCATYPTGYVVSTLVLGLLYSAVLTPLGLILRVCGHDPLGRRFDPAAQSYWRKRTAARPPASYFRQH